LPATILFFSALPAVFSPRCFKNILLASFIFIQQAVTGRFARKRSFIQSQ